MNSKTLIAAALAASFGFAGNALAQQDMPPPPPEWEQQTPPPTPEPAPATELSEDSITQALERMGYSEIGEVEKEGDQWTVEATHPTGDEVKVTVDARTARIISVVPKDQG